MIKVIEDGLSETAMKARMRELETRREALEGGGKLWPVKSPLGLTPKLAEIYRRQGGDAHEATRRGDGNEVREADPRPVEAIVIGTEDGFLRIEVRGDLAGILALRRRGHFPIDQQKLVPNELVAGAGFLNLRP